MELVPDGQPHRPSSLLVPIRASSPSPLISPPPIITTSITQPSEHAAAPIFHTAGAVSSSPANDAAPFSSAGVINISSVVSSLPLLPASAHLSIDAREIVAGLGGLFEPQPVFTAYLSSIFRPQRSSFSLDALRAEPHIATSFGASLNSIATLIGVIEGEPIERAALEKTAREIIYESFPHGIVPSSSASSINTSAPPVNTPRKIALSASIDLTANDTPPDTAASSTVARLASGNLDERDTLPTVSLAAALVNPLASGNAPQLDEKQQNTLALDRLQKTAAVIIKHLRGVNIDAQSSSNARATASTATASAAVHEDRRHRFDTDTPAHGNPRHTIVHVADTPCTAFIDTGADVCVMDAAYFERLPAKLRQTAKRPDDNFKLSATRCERPSISPHCDPHMPRRFSGKKSGTKHLCCLQLSTSIHHRRHTHLRFTMGVGSSAIANHLPGTRQPETGGAFTFQCFITGNASGAIIKNTRLAGKFANCRRSGSSSTFHRAHWHHSLPAHRSFIVTRRPQHHRGRHHQGS